MICLQFLINVCSNLKFNLSSRKIFFLISIFIVIGFSIISNPIRTGDGYEYSLITKAFVNHQSPNVTSEDINDRIKDIKTYPNSGYSIEYFEAIKKGIESNKSSFNSPYTSFFLSKDGHYYGYHFWFYSLIVAIIEIILNIFHLNPLIAFQLTNGLFLLLGIFIILNNERNFAIYKSILFLTGGILYYWKWTHPEVMIYTCIFLYYYFLVRNSYKESILFIAIASTQVISLSLLYLFIPLWIYVNQRNKFWKNFLELLRDFKIWILGLLSLSSLIFYYLNYNKFSLIGDDYSSLSNINTLHFISYWFDLDQGVWVGAPWILVALLFHNYKSKSSNI
ncbi:hypothetical protein, partial [Snodgrassella alvi]|uniref:hypothetical protein n=1 Tax=Snodgrassella alvi TaxID=1196083 RepID=UPI00117BCED9